VRGDLGCSVGRQACRWQREEYEAAGLTFEGRGRLLDHTLEVCQTLWRDRRASYSSPELTFDAIHQMPKPLKNGGVPFWIAGTIRNTTIRRIARFGTGWIPWGPDAVDLTTSIPRLKDALANVGGNPDQLQVAGNIRIRPGAGTSSMRQSMDHVAAQQQAGVTDFVLNASIPRDQRAAEDMLRSVVASFRLPLAAAHHKDSVL
jgi:alkanesulfonate monooxygenase SsuD/methylene tetrahydromethanopterin reductase-like flavin-dependent oxidoreductase (luciferase family)